MSIRGRIVGIARRMHPRRIVAEIRETPRRWRAYRQQFLADLDAEKITGFQAMYYVFLCLDGLYQAAVAEGAPEPVAVSLGHPNYELWIALIIISPVMTLVGRRIYRRAGHSPDGERNPALGAAWAQFVGDGGVWGAILIYFACFVQTFYWGKPLFVTVFYFMGIPGGAMFTYRSWRRIREIQLIDRQLKQSP